MDVLEQKRKERPDLAQFFQEDRLSGFFVKNLEAVQGDERDVIILSLGYGKDSQGRFTMNFGPINKDGGERRLNVIVTRAKEKIVLVASIKATDFDLNSINTEGVRHLYHYLDYAERGKEALSLENIFGGETESPFEDEVK
jgi:superfamily I DNA and/or RNA helicase